MCAAFLFVTFWGEVLAAPAELSVSPNVVRIGTWYDGAKLHVRANISRGCHAKRTVLGHVEERGGDP